LGLVVLEKLSPLSDQVLNWLCLDFEFDFCRGDVRVIVDVFLE
jgi:hypothetical protein